MKNSQSSTATPQREKLTIDQRLNRLQSLLNTVNMACIGRMNDGGDQNYYDLANATEIASNMIDEIADELETIRA